MASFDTQQVAEVFDFSLRRIYGEKIMRLHISGSTPFEYALCFNSTTYKTSWINIFDAFTVSFDNITVQLALSQRFSIKFDKEISFNITTYMYDDEPEDDIVVDFYKDPYFPSIIFVVDPSETVTTNPDENYP